MSSPVISRGHLTPKSLSNRVAVVTGAGGGIGFECARALLWLGAVVAIAEIDEGSGRDAAERLAAEFGPGRVRFIRTDVADQASVSALAAEVAAQLGPVDIVVNNATYAPVGTPVAELPIEWWDRSYGVNLRGPALLARAFLPSMIAAGRGVFVCVSSTGGPFLAAYETLKAAQVALGAALDQELDGSGVIAFTIGPGLVPTKTAVDAIEMLAPRLGMSITEFYALNRGALISVEAAGAGFAAAVAMAERYSGQEISSAQALVDAGIEVPDDGSLPEGVELPAVEHAPSEPAEPAVEPAEPAIEPAAPAIEPGTLPDELGLAHAVRTTLSEQSAGWKQRSFFERQWMLRDFKQRAGMPVERWLDLLTRLEEKVASGDRHGALADVPPLDKLAAYYGHMADLARGYVKDPRQRDEQVGIVLGWQRDVQELARALSGPAQEMGNGRPRGVVGRPS